MADNPYNKPTGSQSQGNPLPYPDRQRPTQQQQQQYQTESNVHPAPPGGQLPYPDRPAKYSDYAQQSSSQPQYQSQGPPSTTYQGPPKQKPAKSDSTPAPQPQPQSGPWPTPPSAYNSSPVTETETQDQGRTSSYKATTAPTSGQPGYSSATPFAMSTVAAALPQLSTSPPAPVTTSPPPKQKYQSSYQSPAYQQQQSSPSPPVSLPPLIPPQNSNAQPNQGPQNPVYIGQQPSYSSAAPVIAGAALGAAAAYSAPQSPVTAPAPTRPQQPYQQTSSPQPISPVYNPQTQPSTGPGGYNQVNTPYVPPLTTSPSPVPGTYVPPSTTSSAPPGYQQSQIPGQGPPGPGQPGYTSPISPAQQYLQSSTPGQLPPGFVPGTVPPSGSFPPPPQTYKPQQPNQGGSVRIDGKDYPIPAFTHTIQSPMQCDPVLRETYFGPYLRFKNVDLAQNLWMGSVLLILPSTLPPPRLEFHPSGDYSRLQAAAPQQIYSYDSYSFYRYEIVVPIFPHEQKWTYAVTTQGTQIWEFLVAGQQQQWRFIAWSCNDFSASVKQEERDKLGFSTLWKDVMERHGQEGGFHAQLGGGDQIYADRMWKEIPFLIEWLGVKGKEQRQHWAWNKEHEDIMRHAYIYYYTSAFAKPCYREALAKIPHVFQIDDHDIFDGYGSYPHYLQQSNVFQGIGKIAFEFYLIFQHHTTSQWLFQHPDPNDLITATGQGWSFIKYFGPTTVILGLDTRTERDKHRIMSQQNYDIVFNRLRQVPPSVIHCVIMLAVPIVYPRLEAVEKALAGVAVAKKGVNGAFNLLGKAVTTITPAGDATSGTSSAFGNVKKAFGKSGLMSSVVSKFGEVDLLDDLMDHWTHANHDRERTMVIRTLQEIAYNRKIRMTFVSGDVHCCGVGYLYDPAHPQDHKLMYQIITSAIVNVPPPGMVIKLLHNNDKLFLPPLNSGQSTKIQSDTKEEMMELFNRDVNGKDLGNMKKLLPRRNYSICKGVDGGSESWEICVERGRGSETIKYGPIIIPRLQ